MRCDYSDNVFKAKMYFISLCLLFILLSIMALPGKEDIYIDISTSFFYTLLKNTYVSLVFLVLAIISYIMCRILEYNLSGTKDLAIQVIEVKEINFEYLTFLTTYIIPLAVLDVRDIRNFFVLFVLLFIIGVIFIKSDFYIANPTLALFGYKLYQIEYKEEETIKTKKVISKSKIQKNDYVESIPFDDSSWYVKVVKYEYKKEN